MTTLDPTHARIEFDLKAGRPLIGVRFDPSGRFVFASAEDDTIRRFDLLTGAAVTLSGHRGWVRGMAFTPSMAPGDVAKFERNRDGLAMLAGNAPRLPLPTPRPFTLISGDYHGKLIWWAGTADAPRPVREVIAHEGWVRTVAVSPDGKLVASCGNDQLVKLWSATGEPVRTLQGHESHVYNVAFHPKEPRLVSCDLKGVVKDWDVATGKLVRDFDAKLLHKYDSGFAADIGGARGMSFAADGSRFACCGITNVSNAFAGVGNPLVIVFDWKGGEVRQLKPKEAFQGTAWGVAFHAAGYVLAGGGGNGGRIWFWKGDEVTSVHQVNVPAGARDFALSPSGERCAAAGANGSVYVYTLLPGTAPAPPAPKTPKKK
jgi:WD40 repeat protein